MAQCPKCHKPIKEGDRFCGSCGARLSPPPAPTLAPEASIARKIEIKGLPGLLHKTLKVEEGCKALLLVEGKHDRTLAPGSHPLDALPVIGTAQKASALLFRSGDIPISLTVERLLTKDPLAVDADVQLQVNIADPLLFLHNLMGEREAVPPEALSAFLQDEVQGAAQAFAGKTLVAGLDADPQVKTRLEMEVTLALENTLSRNGLRLASLRTARFRHPRWDEVTGKRVDYFLQVSAEEARLEGAKRLFEVFSQAQLQSLAEEEARAVFQERRFQILGRLRRAVASEEVEKLRSQADLEKLVLEIDKEKLLRQEELEGFKHSLAEAGEDREKARAHLLKRLEIEQDLEVRKLALAGKRELSEGELALELDLARRELEGRLEIELRRLDLELEMKRRQAEFERERQRIAEEDRIRHEEQKARTTAAIEDLDRESIKKDLEMALGAYEQQRRIKREDELERQRAEVMRQAEEVRIRLMEEEGKLNIRLREMRERSQMEMERIKALSGADIDLLIAVSGEEQARLLTDLARTRTLKDASPQQILALQAEKNPQVVDALKEVLVAVSATGNYQQYERLIAELKESARLSREDYQNNLQRLMEMFHKSLDSVKETAVAFSGQQQG